MYASVNDVPKCCTCVVRQMFEYICIFQQRLNKHFGSVPIRTLIIPNKFIQGCAYCHDWPVAFFYPQAMLMILADTKYTM